MSESPDGDKLTDGDGLFDVANTADAAPIHTLAQDSDGSNDQTAKGVDNVLYSDVRVARPSTYLRLG